MIKSNNKQVVFGAYVKAYIKAHNVVPSTKELQWCYNSMDTARIKTLAEALFFDMYNKEIYVAAQQAEFKKPLDYQDWIEKYFVNDAKYYFKKYVAC